MKSRYTMMALTAGLLILVVLAPVVASAGAPATPAFDRLAQAGPTTTPNDPNWLGFAAARDALSEKIKQRITWVRSYTWAQTEFLHGIIDGCTTLAEGVEEPKIYFGWRYIITLLNNNQYEVRVSFDLENVIICDQVTVDASGSSSGGAPAAPGQVAAGPLEIGGQIQGGLTAEAQNAARSAKMTWIKRQVRVGIDNGVGIVADVKSKGFKVLMSVLGDRTQATNPSYHDTYAAYVADLARAGADAIQVWNETNIDREWPTGQISGASYVELLKKAYAAIKAANPNTIVVTAAPAPTGAAGGAGCNANLCNDDVYYRQMATAGAAQYTNCIGVHYNEGVVSPRSTSGDPRDNYPTRYFQSMLNRALSNFPGMPACFSELGYLTPQGYGPLPPLFGWAQNTTIQQQSQWLAEAVVLASQLGNVRLIVVFNLDFKTYDADPQAGYAIIRADGTCPACTSLAGTRP